MTALDPRTLQSMHHCPVEAKIARKLAREMKKARNDIVSVWYEPDGSEKVEVNGENEILNAIFAVDICWLVTKTGAWVFFIIGNAYDAISDYTTDLEPIMDPVLDWASELEMQD
mgnify:CR=1 FL=1